MNVRVKVFCSDIREVQVYQPGAQGYGIGYQAVLTGVYDGSEENKAFFHATPAVNLTMSTLKEMPFEKGKEYYINIVPAL